jgi:ribosome-binding factor A
MATTFRSDRAAESIRMSVSRTLRESIADPALQEVTITRVEVTHDLSFARIFYTVLGGNEERLAAQNGFDRATPFIRSKVGEEVPLRTVPEIRFQFDKGVENQMRLEEIFATLPELQKEEK